MDEQVTTYRGELHLACHGEGTDILFLICPLGDEGHRQATYPYPDGTWSWNRPAPETKRCAACGQADCDEPLASLLEAEMEERGRFLSIRYGTGATPIDDLDALQILTGEGEAECHHRYSDITGYLWTDEEITVGGHDLLAELNHALSEGRPHLTMEVRFSREPIAVEA